MKNIFEVEAGENIYNFVLRIKNILRQSNYTHAEVSFNEIDLTIYNDSNVSDIITIYSLRQTMKDYRYR